MKMAFGLCTIFLVFSWALVAYASDPSQLQDFCVAVPDAKNAGKYLQYNLRPTIVQSYSFYI